MANKHYSRGMLLASLAKAKSNSERDSKESYVEQWVRRHSSNARNNKWTLQENEDLFVMNYKGKRESSCVNDVLEKVEEIDLAEKETNLNVTNKNVEYGFDETLVEMRRLEKDVSVDSEVKHVKGESVVNDILDVHLDIGEGKDLVPENKNIEYVVDEALKGVKSIDVENVHLDIGEGKDLVHRIENSVDGNPSDDRGNSNADDIHRRLGGVDSSKTCSFDNAMNIEGYVDFSVMTLNHERAAYNPQHNDSSETDSEDALAHSLEDVNNVLGPFQAI